MYICNFFIYKYLNYWFESLVVMQWRIFTLVSTAYINCTLNQEDLNEDKPNNIVEILASSPRKLAELVVNKLKERNNR